MGDHNSWEHRWNWCSLCRVITPHIPELQNWGAAHAKCEICGNSNLFMVYSEIQKTERRYIHARKATTPRKKEQEQT